MHTSRWCKIPNITGKVRIFRFVSNSDIALHKLIDDAVIEVDWEGNIVWQCRPMNLGYLQPFHADHIYSMFISSAQRLPNGNTLITEGADGRLFEVTVDHELVKLQIRQTGLGVMQKG